MIFFQIKLNIFGEARKTVHFATEALIFQNINILLRNNKTELKKLWMKNNRFSTKKRTLPDCE